MTAVLSPAQRKQMSLQDAPSRFSNMWVWPVALLLIILPSLLTIIGRQQFAGVRNDVNFEDFQAITGMQSESSGRECLVARIASTLTFDPSIYSLPKPVINLGFPKVGSTTMHEFFECAGFRSSHHMCDSKGFIKFNNNRCGVCFKNAIRRDRPMLKTCGNYDAWTQIDSDGLFYPQMEHLQRIHDESPSATFVLPFRDIRKWIKSLENWSIRVGNMSAPKSLKHLIAEEDLPGLPPGVGHTEQELVEWWCWHVENVREFVRIHPSHALVEVDIEDPLAGSMMGTLFGAQPSCWGHASGNQLKEPASKGEGP